MTTTTKPAYLSSTGFAIAGPTTILRQQEKGVWCAYDAAEDAGDGNTVLDYAVYDKLHMGSRWRNEIIEMLAAAGRLSWDVVRAYQDAQKTADAVNHARLHFAKADDPLGDERMLAELRGGPGAGGEPPLEDDRITYDEAYDLRAVAAAAYEPIQAVVDGVIVRLNKTYHEVDEARTRIASRQA